MSARSISKKKAEDMTLGWFWQCLGLGFSSIFVLVFRNPCLSLSWGILKFNRTKTTVAFLDNGEVGDVYSAQCGSLKIALQTRHMFLWLLMQLATLLLAGSNSGSCKPQFQLPELHFYLNTQTNNEIIHLRRDDVKVFLSQHTLFVPESNSSHGNLLKKSYIE